MQREEIFNAETWIVLKNFLSKKNKYINNDQVLDYGGNNLKASRSEFGHISSAITLQVSALKKVRSHFQYDEYAGTYPQVVWQQHDTCVTGAAGHGPG